MQLALLKVEYQSSSKKNTARNKHEFVKQILYITFLKSNSMIVKGTIYTHILQVVFQCMPKTFTWENIMTHVCIKGFLYEAKINNTDC